MSARPLLYPATLPAGATFGLVATASPPAEAEKIGEAIERLRAHGFRVKPGKHLEERDGYLAGTDEERAGDLQAAFADPEVDAVLALRGGYGSIRLLPLLDYAAIRAAQKPFIGYSDNTALHLALYKESGLVSFHGPNASEAFLPGNEMTFLHTLFRPEWLRQATNLFFRAGATGKHPKTLVPGKVSGPLLGGNMTCLLRLVGTPYEPDFRGAILFLEDTGEKAYRVDGMFTHLRLAGILEQIGGLVLGKFDHCEEPERWRIEGCLKREAERIGVPCVADAPIGHMPEQIIVPHGAGAELNAGEGSLKIVPAR
jgi:muramoyltetrapeptide carboxypeptidase